jgi:hypothetical protein
MRGRRAGAGREKRLRRQEGRKVAKTRKPTYPKLEDIGF